MSWYSFTLDELAYRVLPQVAPGRALADSEWLTLQCAAEILLEALPIDIDATRAADNVERFLCAGRSKRAWRCRVLLTLLELLPLSTHARRFSAMSAPERRRLFEAQIVGAHGLWGICAKVRYLVLMGAYGDESVPEQLGVWVPGATRPRRAHARHSLPVAQSGNGYHSSPTAP